MWRARPKPARTWLKVWAVRFINSCGLSGPACANKFNWCGWSNHFEEGKSLCSHTNLKLTRPCYMRVGGKWATPPRSQSAYRRWAGASGGRWMDFSPLSDPRPGDLCYVPEPLLYPSRERRRRGGVATDRAAGCQWFRTIYSIHERPPMSAAYIS